MILGLLGASFVAGWASDEGRRRTDLILSAPLSADVLDDPAGLALSRRS